MLKHLAPLVLHNRVTEITYFVTSRCNFRCKHCYLLDKLNKKHDELTVEELQKIGKHISTLQRVHIAGGEPFMRKDISQVIEVIAQEWDSEIICLPTNGSFKKKAIETVENYAKKCNKSLRLHYSLNALDDTFDEFTSSKNSFEKWKSNISEVRKITSQLPHVTLTSLITYNDYNQHNFEELLNFVLNEIGVDDLSIGLVRSHANYAPDLDIDKFNNIIQNYFRNNPSQNIFVKSYRELIRKKFAQYHTQKECLTKCYSGQVRVVLSPEGDVYPCETKGYPEGSNQEQYLMGNIRDFDYNIHKVINSPKAKEILKRIKDEKCHCQQGVDMSLSLLCSNSFKFEVLWNALGILFKKEKNRAQ